MHYTDIQKLIGLTVPADYGSGIEYADGLLELSSTPAEHRHPIGLQIGLWLNGTQGCTDLVHGDLDLQVKRLYQYLMEDCRAIKVFLRVGYEFDNGFFGYSSDPEMFRAAFRHLVNECCRLYSHKSCSKKIAFVWHSWGAGLPDNVTLDSFYPGDDYVDWIGVSLFSQVYADPNRTVLGHRDTVLQVLDFATQHDNKPVMIAESTPFGGIDTLNDPWNDWFEPVLQLIEEYDIAMWSYINCDWNSQPMWHNVGFGDTRLSTNATIMKFWKQRVLDNPRFVMSLSCNQNNNANPVLVELSIRGMHPNVPLGYWIAGSVLITVALLCHFLVLCRGRASAISQGYAPLGGDDKGVITETKQTDYGSSSEEH